jgi:lipopolysaccharide biosynthesis protein
MKILAFYLPQFHHIPENDEWWGEGFTDWVKVKQAKPRFKGHYQPHVPSELGYYDLRSEETRIAQAALAKQYGIYGFCHYHYWFNGKMLLERPFNEVLRSGKPDFPFCLCWANHNWTRRWDGNDREVLIKQDYKDYDPSQHIDWLNRAFFDRRYIKINGKPLFLVYDAGSIPGIEQKVQSWRKAAAKKGYPGIYLSSVKSFPSEITDSATINYGFDSVTEFQPDKELLKGYAFLKLLKNITDKLNLNKITKIFTTTHKFNYEKLVEKYISQPERENMTFPCVMPSWDNTPRKLNSIIIHNNNADAYREWLENALSRVKAYPDEEQIVFINAWNEWAEGCHLEPDVKNGRLD